MYDGKRQTNLRGIDSAQSRERSKMLGCRGDINNNNQSLFLCSCTYSTCIAGRKCACVLLRGMSNTQLGFYTSTVYKDSQKYCILWWDSILHISVTQCQLVVVVVLIGD